MFIVIEGLDGVGKSTVGKALANSLNAVFYKTPPTDFEPIRELVNNCPNRDAQFYYYLSSVFYASSQIEEVLKSGQSLVCDRYYYTTLSAYPDIIEETYPKFWQNLEGLTNRFIQPDFAFLLTVVNQNERKERLDKRGILSQDDVDSLDGEIIDKTIAIYRLFNLIEIQTDGLSVDDVVREINNYLIG